LISKTFGIPGFHLKLVEMMNKELNVLDLFCGCGGLSIGLEQAGFNIKWANDIWEPAVESYKVNHPTTQLYAQDGRDFLNRIIERDKSYPNPGDVDVVVGGPPCQGFSGWNRHRSSSDPRNSLVDVYFDIVSCLKPAVAVMENVTGILSLDNGKAIQSIVQGFEDIRYQVDFFVVQAGGYGLAQNRWRVILIASQPGLNMPVFIQPFHSFPRTVTFNATKFRTKILRPYLPANLLAGLALPNLTVNDAIGDLPRIENGGSCPAEAGYTNRTKIQHMLFGAAPINDHVCIKLGELNMRRVSALPPNSGKSWVDLPTELKPRNLVKGGNESYDNRFGRLVWNGIFNTMVTKPDPYWGRFIHPEQDRVLSVRECARVQGFPDSASFSGKLREKYMQIGNAVPPPLGRAVGWSIQEIFGNAKWISELELYKNGITS
jgi:DNA (cytosine-5)-methyltransferase 1